MRTLLLSALLLATASAFAAAPLTFEEVDTDGDGLVSADEAASVEGLDFDAADGDGDGALTVDEYEIAAEGLPPPAEGEITEDTGDAESPDAEGPDTSVAPLPPLKGGAAPPAVQPPPATPPKP